MTELAASKQQTILELEREKEDLLQRANKLEEKILHLKSGKI